MVTPLGYEVLKSYDHANRLIKEEHIEKNGDIHNVISYQYDKAGNLVILTDGDGSSVKFEYDCLDRQVKRQNADGGITYKYYNKDSYLSCVIMPNEYQKEGENASGYRYQYDNLGRITQMIAPDGNILKQRTYTSWGAVESEKNSMSGGVSYQYDLGGRQTEVITTMGSRQRYVYNAVGDVIGTEDGNGNRTGFELDQWGRGLAI